MTKKTPEEIAALKAKYAEQNAGKSQAKADKKAKYAEQNAEKNTPIVELRVPWTTSWRNSDGTFWTKDIDIEKEPWASASDRAEYAHRFNIWLDTEVWPEYPLRVRVIRTDSNQEETLRRLYGRDIVFQEK